ncbi:hypothetical protein F4677DRAFT_426747 [Hypoxylon crocopeplum]|nr:hypothetical protein F4677DRAFT_426747 [Hypoxylon crocopeplum]
MILTIMLLNFILFNLISILSLVASQSLVEQNPARIYQTRHEKPLPSSRWRHDISQSIRRSRRDFQPLDTRDNIAQEPPELTPRSTSANKVKT